MLYKTHTTYGSIYATGDTHPQVGGDSCVVIEELYSYYFLPLGKSAFIAATICSVSVCIYSAKAFSTALK